MFRPGKRSINALDARAAFQTAFQRKSLHVTAHRILSEAISKFGQTISTQMGAVLFLLVGLVGVRVRG